jgi:hypothetical protein
MTKETLQDFYERLLIDNVDYNAIRAASTTLWGMLIGNTTEEEDKIITNAAMAIDKVLEIFNSKT